MNRLLAAFLAATLFPPAGRATQLPAADFFRNPKSCNYRLSPDGNTFSFLQQSGPKKRLNIFVKSVFGGDAKCVTSEVDRDIPEYYWKGNGRLVYLFDPNGDQRTCVRCVDLKSGEVTPPLTPLQSSAYLIDELADSEEEILIGLNERDPTVFDVYRLNVAQNQWQMVEKNPGDVRRWISDQHGVIRAEITLDGLDTCLLTRKNATSPFRTVLTNDFRHSIDSDLYIFNEQAVPFFPIVSWFNAVLFTFRAGKGKEAMYAVSSIGRDKKALVAINPQTGRRIGPPLYENPEFDVSGMEFSKRRGITSATFATWRNRRKCLDTTTTAIYRTLDQRFPNQEVWITNSDKDEQKFIVEVSSDQNPGECYLLERKSNKLTKLTEFEPQLKGRLLPMKCIKLTSRDGRVIHGYLTRPARKENGKVPLVVIPHGGPWLRNVWGFNRENRETQFFANRGYAVLQLDFRGSTGYGCKFWIAGFKQWGAAMQDDVTDGVRWALSHENVDPKRIAIVGESYGGYAALVGITYPPDGFRYAVAVDRAGVSDLMTFMDSIPPYSWGKLPRLREMVGDPVRDADMLSYFSPARHTNQIKTPLFLAHGLNDSIVNHTQSDQIHDALLANGVDVEYRTFANEGHIFENEENRIAYYEAMDKFLAKYLR